MLERKSILARLLAKENLEVIQGSFRTASFDVQNRKLRLPLFKDMSSDLYDLMVGHEVGHALYTPAEGWHDAVKNYEFPHSYVNIIEDIRIERDILAQYPGMVSNFKRGYSELLEMDFFGLSKRDINDLSFMDRLNVKSKCRDLMDVPFLEEELPYVEMAYNTQSFEDVIEVCQAIWEFMKDKKNNEAETNNEDVYAENSEESDDMDQTESTQDSSDASGDENSENQKAEGSSDSEAGNDENEGEKKPVTSAGNGDQSETYTDDMFRRNEDKLVEQDRHGRQPFVCQGIGRKRALDAITPYSVLEEARKNPEKSWHFDDYRFDQLKEDLEIEYKAFAEQTKKVVNTMSKEFEMRKAAYQNRRATTARSGALDVNKLHAYKLTDDIFLRSTSLPNAKDHGMYLMIDFSGSMGGVIKNVVDQAIVLASFCRKVGIPFEVISFTTGGQREDRYEARDEIADHELHDYHLNICQQLSSTMNRATFENACKGLYKSMRGLPSKYDQLGGTPTIETLAILDYAIAEFRAKNKFQKMNFVMISDGEPGYIQTKNGGYGYAGTHIKIGNKYINIDRNCRDQEAVIKYLKKRHNMTTVCYFIADGPRDINWRFTDDTAAARKEMRKNGFFMKKDDVFDGYFVINGRIDAMDEEFEVKEDAKKADIARAFKKFTSSKKTNRAMAAKFAEVIS